MLAKKKHSSLLCLAVGYKEKFYEALKSERLTGDRCEEAPSDKNEMKQRIFTAHKNDNVSVYF
jgi:hypothetical protein